MCGIITDCDLNLYIVIIEMKQKKKGRRKREEKNREESGLRCGRYDVVCGVGRRRKGIGGGKDEGRIVVVVVRGGEIDAGAAFKGGEEGGG